MTKRKMATITTGINLFCALIWCANFFIHWHVDGAISLSTILFGVAGLLFAVAGIGGLINLRKLPKEDK